MSKEFKQLQKIADKIKTKMAKRFAHRAEKADRIQNPHTAVKILTLLETEQLNQEQQVDSFVELAERYLEDI